MLFLFRGLKLDITSVNKIIKSQSRFLYLRHSAIKFENWKMKNRFLILNFPIKIGNWKLKIFYHFSIFKIFKLYFYNLILNWKLNGTFGARIVLCLNFSTETKIKTLFLISHFNLPKTTKRNGTLIRGSEGTFDFWFKME